MSWSTFNTFVLCQNFAKKIIFQVKLRKKVWYILEMNNSKNFKIPGFQVVEPGPGQQGLGTGAGGTGYGDRGAGAGG